jgi:hypothetical protein
MTVTASRSFAVLAAFAGNDVTATLDPSTELECSGAGDQSDDDAQGDDDQGENDQQQPGCDASLLTAGRLVREAESEATAGGLQWHKIQIVR